MSSWEGSCGRNCIPVILRPRALLPRLFFTSAFFMQRQQHSLLSQQGACAHLPLVCMGLMESCDACSVLGQPSQGTDVLSERSLQSMQLTLPHGGGTYRCGPGTLSTNPILKPQGPSSFRCHRRDRALIWVEEDMNSLQRGGRAHQSGPDTPA